MLEHPQRALPGRAIIDQRFGRAFGPDTADAAIVSQQLGLVAGVLGTAHVALAEDHRHAQVAVHETLEGAQEIGGVQVVAVQALGVLAPVHPGRQRLRAGLGERVKPHHHQAQITVFQRVAGRGAVIGGGQAHHVALENLVAHGGGAHARRLQVLLGDADRCGHLPGLVLEEARVEDVLEHPHAPGHGRRIGRGVIMGGAVQDLLVVDAGTLLAQDLGDATDQRVLRQIVVGLDHGHALAVVAFHHDRARGQPRLHAVAGVLGFVGQEGVDVIAADAVEDVGGIAVLAGAIAHVRGHVGDADAGADVRAGVEAQQDALGVGGQISGRAFGITGGEIAGQVAGSGGDAGVIVIQRCALQVVGCVVAQRAGCTGDGFGIAAADGTEQMLAIRRRGFARTDHAVLAAVVIIGTNFLHRRRDGGIGCRQSHADRVRAFNAKAHTLGRVLDRAVDVVADGRRGHEHEVVRAGAFVEQAAGVITDFAGDRVHGFARLALEVAGRAGKIEGALGQHLIVGGGRAHVAQEVVGGAQEEMHLRRRAVGAGHHLAAAALVDRTTVAQALLGVREFLTRRGAEEQVANAEGAGEGADLVAGEPRRAHGAIDAGFHIIGVLAVAVGQAHQRRVVGVENRVGGGFADELLAGRHPRSGDLGVRHHAGRRCATSA